LASLEPEVDDQVNRGVTEGASSHGSRLCRAVKNVGCGMTAMSTVGLFDVNTVKNIRSGVWLGSSDSLMLILGKLASGAIYIYSIYSVWIA